MTKYIVKSITCPIEGEKFWAENENDKSDWSYLTPNVAAELGGVGAVVEATSPYELQNGIPDPVHVADDDGMQAAIGAAHVEPHVEDEFVSIGTEDPEYDRDFHFEVVESFLNPEKGERVEVAEDMSQEQREKSFAEATELLREVIFSPEFGKSASYLVVVKPTGSTGTTMGNLSPRDAVTLPAEYAGRMMGMPAMIASLFGMTIERQVQDLLGKTNEGARD